jgi:hypothetical protein
MKELNRDELLKVLGGDDGDDIPAVLLNRFSLEIDGVMAG